MKFKLPAFLENVETPVEGEVALRKYAANPLAFGGDLDLFSAGGVGAGPVVACAAVLKAPDIMPELNDSKKLTRPKREAMYDAVKEACACYAIASASVEEIDRMNILEADFLAMRRALQALGMPGLNETAPEIPIEVKGSFADLTIFIAVDGNLMIRGVPAEMQMPVVKGDGRIASISAASVLAKVFRDRYMDKLAETYPGYGFEVHAGYGTKAHLDAIRKLGFTPAHRKSFHPKSL